MFYAEVPNGGGCDDDSQCLDENAICVNSTCQCRPCYYDNSGTCEEREKLILQKLEYERPLGFKLRKGEKCFPEKMAYQMITVLLSLKEIFSFFFSHV